MFPEHERKKYAALEVLVVDDDAFVLRAVQNILKDMGISQITTAANGEEALDYFSEGSLSSGRMVLDIVICDWMMPGPSGLDVLRAVRAEDPNIPFVMLTSKVTQDAILAAKEEGVSAYVAKPVVPAELQKKVHALMIKARKISEF